MRKSKLIQYLKKMDKKELKSFDLFVRSPFFNRKNDVVELYDYLKDYYPDFENLGISKYELHAKLFPERDYNDKEMRYLMTYLAQLLEEYFVVNRIWKQPDFKSIVLLEDFLDRYPLKKAFRQIFNATQDRLNKLGLQSEHRSELNHKLYKVADSHFLIERERRNDENLQLSSDQFDRYYILRKLKYSCAMLNRTGILSGTYELHFIDDIQKWIKSNLFKDAPLIQLYSRILEMQLHGYTIQSFKELKAMLISNESIIHPDELPSIYQYAINFCLSKLRAGEDAFIEEALELYTKAIDMGILLQNNKLSPWTFTNIVKLALRSKRFDWTNDFINRNAEILPKNFQENVTKYNLAEMHFYKKEFDQALGLLQEVSFSDINFHLGSRLILAKTYYENKVAEPLLSLISSFSIYLKRNKKISSQLKTTYLNFCLFLKKIIRAKDKEKLQELHEQIKSSDLLTDRKWLLEKIQIKQQTLRN